MAAAIDAFDKDNEAKVLVFNGEGGSFCSGFDIDDMGAKGYNTLKDAAVSYLMLIGPPSVHKNTGHTARLYHPFPLTSRL